MRTIWKENQKYIIAVLILWAVVFPWIWASRDSILTYFSLLFKKPGFHEKLALDLLKKSKQVLEDEKVSIGLLQRACEYYIEKEKTNIIFEEPNWREKEILFRDKDAKLNSEFELSKVVDPKEYFQEHIKPALHSLDYAKRALNYSGPLLEIPKWVETISRATCRQNEIPLAYASYVYELEAHSIRFLENQNLLPKGLSDKQKTLVAWSFIRSGKIPYVNLKDFLFGLESYLLWTRLSSHSFREADAVFERLIYFSQYDEIKRSTYQLKRAELLLRISTEIPEMIPKAEKQFQDAGRFQNSQEIEESGMLGRALAIQFESQLGRARCKIQEKNFKTAVQILESMRGLVRNVDERSLLGENKTLLKLYTDSLRYSYTKLARYSDSDAIE